MTYDDVNQREWLDLSQTILNEQFPGATRDDKYQYVISQLGIGGAFQGFTVAKIAEGRALAASAGIDASVISSAANVAPVDGLGQLLGFTILSNSGNGFVGLLDELGPPPMSQRVGAMFSINLIAQPPRAGLRINSNDDLIYSPSARPPAVMLYRAVPEGSSMLMAVLAGGRLRGCWGRSRPAAPG
ncbi:MAG: hypothetical protein IT424_06075 [Pirellulales bacterium]|nr:hypothetical protein [Pirellulales bacterium]